MKRALRFLLLSTALLLATCGGHGRGSVPPPTILTVGLALSDTVARGTFNAYQVEVSPGRLYKISITNQTDDTDLLVFGTDGSYTTLVTCSIDNTSIIGTSPEDCVIVAPGATLFFGADGTFLTAGAATYTIDIEAVNTTAITLSTPLADSTTPRTATLYTLSVSPGVAYSAAITGLSGDADLHVFGNDSTLTQHAACSPDNTRYTRTTPEDCTFVSSGASLSFIVDGIFSSATSVQYTVLAAPAPSVPVPANEGTVTVPVQLALNAPVTGQVGFAGISYYAISGLSPGTRYTVYVLGLSANANLNVFGSDSTYTAPASCLVDNTFFRGTIPEDCTLMAASSSLYFTVAASTTSGGAAFINLVVPGPE